MPFSELSLATFWEELASKRPVPGGGAAAALAGAAAAAQAEMCAQFSTGEKFSAVEAEIASILEELAAARRAFSALMDRDAAAYQAWRDARKLPKDSPEERAMRQAALQAAEQEAIAAPLDICRQAERVQRINLRLTEIANSHLLADVNVAAGLALAALTGAATQVMGNLAQKKLKPADTPEGRAALACKAVCRELAAEIQRRVMQAFGLPADTLD
jgi:formiminotetrahydrofolate cyclodeaminase